MKSFPLEESFNLFFWKKWNNNAIEIIPSVDFISIAILIIWSRIFLKIYTPAPEKFLKRVQDVFIFLDEFEVEFWFHPYSSFSIFPLVDIFYIDSNASFTSTNPTM